MRQLIINKAGNPRINNQEFTENMNRSAVEEGLKKNAVKRVCAWCSKVLENGKEPATHGICPECLIQEITRYCEARKLQKGQFKAFAKWGSQPNWELSLA